MLASFTQRVPATRRARSIIATIATVACFGSALLVGSSSGVVHAATLAIVPAHCSAVYVVRWGDTLATIAGRAHTTWPALRTINQIDDPNRIWPGERVCLAIGTVPAPLPATGRPVHAAHVGDVDIVNDGDHDSPADMPAPPAPVAVVTHPAPPPAPPAPPVVSGIPSNDYCQGVPRAAAFATTVSSWAVPAGCFAGIWRPNPYAPQFLINGQTAGSPGWCNWWPEEMLHRAWVSQLHPTGLRAGVAVHFAPGDQGASFLGHWGYVEAVGTNGWVLISEMNDTWRGAGFGLVNYRFVRLDGGLSFYTA